MPRAVGSGARGRRARGAGPGVRRVAGGARRVRRGRRRVPDAVARAARPSPPCRTRTGCSCRRAASTPRTPRGRHPRDGPGPGPGHHRRGLDLEPRGVRRDEGGLRGHRPRRGGLLGGDPARADRRAGRPERPVHLLAGAAGRARPGAGAAGRRRRPDDRRTRPGGLGGHRAEQRLDGVYDGVGATHAAGGLPGRGGPRGGPAEPAFVWASEEQLAAQSVEPWAGPRSLPVWVRGPRTAASWRTT